MTTRTSPRGLRCRIALSALSLTGMLAGSLSAPAAQAATTLLIDPAFYAPPAGWQDYDHGSAVKLVEALAPQAPEQLANPALTAFWVLANYSKQLRAWRVMYTTTGPDANRNPAVAGAPLLATGMIIAPVGTPWTGTGPRPIVVFAPKTQGLGSNCAPTKALEVSNEETSEVKRIIAALDKGYIVALTDYDGYTDNSPTHHYLVGHTLGHAVLDMALATRQVSLALNGFDTVDANGVKRVNISYNSPMAIWGYSEGGTAAAWAGQMLTSYAPSLSSLMKGIATGGMVADPKMVSIAMDGMAASGLMLSATWGYHTAYPKPFSQGGLYFDINDTFKSEILGDNYAYKYTLSPPSTDTPHAMLHADECVSQVGADLPFKTIRTRNNGGYTVSQMLTDTDTRKLNWDAVLTANTVGNIRIPVPVFYYHGSTATSTNADGSAKEGDVILPVGNFNGVYTRMCASGTKVLRKVVLSSYYFELNHATASDKAFGDVTAWLADRFNNVPAVGSCN